MTARRFAIVRGRASPDATLERIASWIAVGALELRPRGGNGGTRREVDDAGTIVDLVDLAAVR